METVTRNSWAQCYCVVGWIGKFCSFFVVGITDNWRQWDEFEDVQWQIFEVWM